MRVSEPKGEYVEKMSAADKTESFPGVISLVRALCCDFRDGASLTSSEQREIIDLAMKHCARDTNLLLEGLLVCSQVVLLRHADGQLGGFVAYDVSTFESDKFEELGTIGLLYTKEAVLEPAFRGRGVIQIGTLLQSIRLLTSFPEISWFCVYEAATYLPYMAMVQTVSTFWPHPDYATPNAMKRLMQVCALRLGIALDEELGLVPPIQPLRFFVDNASAQFSAKSNKFSRHYALLNPKQADGYSVFCMFPFSVRAGLGAIVIGLERVTGLLKLRRSLEMRNRKVRTS